MRGSEPWQRGRGRSLLAAAGLGAAAAGLLLASRARKELSLAGRVVLISGGSRGLGLELARRFAAEGARLGLLARSEAELERARAGLPGAEAMVLPCDLRDPAAVQGAVNGLVERFGRLDVLANVAGIVQVAPLADLTLSDFRDAMETNYFGALHATLAALPHLRRSGAGRIVNVTSIGGRVAVPHLLPYTASKFALVGLSEGLRAELAGAGVKVTTVTPGLMRTGSPYRATFKGRQREEFAWFLLADSLPGLSMDAARAARRIVRACRQGRASLVLPGYVRLPVALHGLAPGLTASLAALANGLLPEAAADGSVGREGREVRAPEDSPGYAALTRRAARRNNQLE